MKLINVIREGDFVRLKTLSQLEKEFGEAKEGGVIGALYFGNPQDINSVFYVYNNVRCELGNVLRIKRVENSEHSDAIFFHAENNGIEYDYEDSENVTFKKQIVDAVLINGKWYKADEDLNILLFF